MKKVFLILLLILSFTANLYCITSHSTYYVKYNATGSNTGASWTDAYTSLQSALSIATSGDQIWVAAGTYKPSSAYDLTNTSRYYHFRMKAGVSIYGGFAGTEGAVNERVNYGVGQINETILSGDLNDNGIDNNDAYHVFYHPSSLALSSTAVLDGFTIKGGNANSSNPHNCGGGMYNNACAPTITNCTFSSNSSNDVAGGMYIFNCNPNISNCIFSSNLATNNAGAFWTDYSSASITNCLFISNSTTTSGGYGGGGAILIMDGYPTFTNCTITSNKSDYGGGVTCSTSADATFNNCIIWGNDATYGDEFYISTLTGHIVALNYCCYGNASGDIYQESGTFRTTNYNITSDPLFVGAVINPTHPYSLSGISPCVDVGNDSYNYQTYDIRGTGYARKLDKTTGGVGTIDMGAYEYLVGTDLLPVELTAFTASANCATVTLRWRTATEVNSYQFEIERRTVKNEQGTMSGWQKIGIVQGAGTSNALKEYSYSDVKLLAGTYAYRLKQVDNDGTFRYSQSAEVSIAVPKEFALSQNYPNPFNPSTTIQFDIPVGTYGNTTLRVFDIVGHEVATLVNEMKEAGNYQVKFDASKFASGIYFYKLNAGSYTAVKKLILMK
jgi:hypothetical protein